MDEVMDETLSRLQVMQAGGSSGVSSGIPSIDSIVGGWQRGNLIIVAARPSVGKTALATAMAANAAINDKKSVAIFSMEMSREEIGSRLLSSLSGVSLHEIRHGLLDMSALTQVMDTAKSIRESNLRVEDSSINTPGDIRSKCRRLAQEHGLDMVIVDYLQLMAPDKQTKDGNRVYDVADISRGLKALARELNVPVVALSQLSRSSEYREGNEPKLSDLRDSGAIEQDADVVLMMWRSSDISLDVSTEPVHCKIAKHRNGPTGRAELLFHRPTATFKGA
jgi:replicative DNA helicase